jgi:hypothetical protein
MAKNKDFSTKSLRVIYDNLGVTLEDRELPWKYYLTIYRSPRKVAKELRKIADWLDRQ